MRRRAGAALLAVCTWWSAACDRADSRTAASSADAPSVDLLGAGATFPYPLYARWFNQFAYDSGVVTNYESIGSRDGIRRLVEGTVDFGASDVPASDAERAQAPGGELLHVPTVVGAVAITYNVPEVSVPLRLTGEVLADLMSGRIRRWNHPRLASLNPTLSLPDRPVLVVHRSDGSGTSFILSEYLAAVSPRWAALRDREQETPWPTGIGGQGNEGVAGHVKQTPGAIGFVEATYARQNRLPIAAIRNASGVFVEPELANVAAAAATAPDGMPMINASVSLVNAAGPDAYPIASFTWIVIAPRALGDTKARQLASLLRWALTDGADIATALGYAALPPPIASRVMAELSFALARAPKQ